MSKEAVRSLVEAVLNEHSQKAHGNAEDKKYLIQSGADSRWTRVPKHVWDTHPGPKRIGHYGV